MTNEEMAELQSMTTAKIRKNYLLCEQQLQILKMQERSTRGDASATMLNNWSGLYLDELVRRDIQSQNS
jgi:hypothetical protein